MTGKQDVHLAGFEMTHGMMYDLKCTLMHVTKKNLNKVLQNVCGDVVSQMCKRQMEETLNCVFSAESLSVLLKELMTEVSLGLDKIDGTRDSKRKVTLSCTEG